MILFFLDWDLVCLRLDSASEFQVTGEGARTAVDDGKPRATGVCAFCRL